MRIARCSIGVLVVTLLLLSGLPRRSSAQTPPATTRRILVPWLVTAPRAPTPPVPPLPTSWLPRLNAYRSAAGLPPIIENGASTGGDDLHVNYMLLNPSLPLQHSEDMSKPGATPQGNVAAQQSNLFGGSPGYNQAQAVDAWMESVMHRFGILRPELTSVGFGMGCTNISCGAALNVLAGLGNPSPIRNVVYPGPGQQGVTTRVFSWQFYPYDPVVVPAGAALWDAHGASVPLTAVSGVPSGYFNVYAVSPAVPLAAHASYTILMVVKQNGQTLQKSWVFTTQ